MKGYRTKDLPEKQELAITPLFLRQIFGYLKKPKEYYLSILYILAFFFTIQSCEYLITLGSRKITNVCLKDIVFVNSKGSTIPQCSLMILAL